MVVWSLWRPVKAPHWELIGRSGPARIREPCSERRPPATVRTGRTGRFGGVQAETAASAHGFRSLNSGRGARSRSRPRLDSWFGSGRLFLQDALASLCFGPTGDRRARPAAGERARLSSDGATRYAFSSRYSHTPRSTSGRLGTLRRPRMCSASARCSTLCSTTMRIVPPSDLRTA